MGVGCGFNGVNTYGELVEAISNTEKRIQEIKRLQGDDYENYIDYSLQLIYLKDLKKYNDKRIELGLAYCLNCESDDIVSEKYYDVERLEYVFDTRCNDCNHREVHRVSIDEFSARCKDKDWMRLLIE